MKCTSRQTAISLHLVLMLVSNLVAAQGNAPPSAGDEREDRALFSINNATPPRYPIGGAQEGGLGRLIRSSFAPGLRLAEESPARQQQRRIQRQLGELIDEALDEQRRRRWLDRQQQQQSQAPQVVLNRRALFEQLEQLSKSYNSDNNELLPSGLAGDGEQPTRLLMMRQLDGIATPVGTEMRTGEAERKRRVSSALKSHSHGRGLISLNTQQLNALQSLNSLIGSDPASAYKPKIISTARGFGK